MTVVKMINWIIDAKEDAKRSYSRKSKKFHVALPAKSVDAVGLLRVKIDASHSNVRLVVELSKLNFAYEHIIKIKAYLWNGDNKFELRYSCGSSSEAKQGSEETTIAKTISFEFASDQENWYVNSEKKLHLKVEVVVDDPTLDEYFYRSAIPTTVAKENLFNEMLKKPSVVTLEAERDGIKLNVNKEFAILFASKSEFFKELIRNSGKKRNIAIPVATNGQVLKEMLRFVSYNKVYDIQNVPNLLITAKMFKIEELVEICTNLMIEKISLENVIELMIWAEKFRFDQIFASCCEKINFFYTCAQIQDKWNTLVDSRLKLKIFNHIHMHLDSSDKVVTLRGYTS